MYIIAEHEISNPKSFWEIAKSDTASLPSGLKLHQILPNGERYEGRLPLGSR